MLWEVDIHPRSGQPDRAAERLTAAAAELGLAGDLSIRTAHGYLLEGSLAAADVAVLAEGLLSDSVVEEAVAGAVGDAALAELPAGANGAFAGETVLLHVLPKPGVMDPVAQSAQQAIATAGGAVDAVRTLRKYWITGTGGGGSHAGQGVADAIQTLADKLLSNDAIEQVVIGPLDFERLAIGSPYTFQLSHTPLSDLDDEALVELSRQQLLSLSLAEMQTIQAHFRSLDRDPTDIELETLAQTWSEHCSHKTLAGRIAYRDERGQRQFENMLRETIFDATQTIRRAAGDDDWCVSVFKDNAGIVRFDDEYNAVFKVETHNHPSALEPYGGANTGIGGVIRDPLGTGLGAKPVCNTDVFCFAPPETPLDALPQGVLHPKLVMQGVVSGVRDYGNRMGIPTINGAVYFDDRYLGNPLVYCGNAGIIPRDKSDKCVQPDDHVVVIGGRTGRDGIHGATFSSIELTHESETTSGGAVQIGNAITEKMVLDCLLEARDRGLYSAVTDCGAGGLSSAVGEMGEPLGAEVWLERVPLKYDGLSYTEIWISEAQERMVLAVPPASWQEFHDLCAAEGVEATVIGRFVPTGRLELKYDGQQVADLSMAFLHNGRPPVVRQANYTPADVKPIEIPQGLDVAAALSEILAAPNVASKEWIIRQYDHEVQGGSVIKPLVGVANDGPSDAAVVRPVLGSPHGLAISCGMNPRYGDFDTYHMAASAIDEAVRNCVAVGADPNRIAILDNFCWGNCERPEQLGSLVRAALACYDVAVALKTPFISGKDSLNNEFRCAAGDGSEATISIPPSLLISAMGRVEDVDKCVTMDLKEPGNLLYVVGTTYREVGGSHLSLVSGLAGGVVPQVDPQRARATFAAIHQAIDQRLVRACHDLSEGGLAVAVAEMAFSGGLGAEVSLANVPYEMDDASELDTVLLFSESNTRFLCEVPSQHQQAFEQALAGLVFGQLGQVTGSPQLAVFGSGGEPLLDVKNERLKQAWQGTLRY